MIVANKHVVSMCLGACLQVGYLLNNGAIFCCPLYCSRASISGDGTSVAPHARKVKGSIDDGVQHGFHHTESENDCKHSLLILSY